MFSLRISLLALAFAMCCSFSLSAQITWMTWDEAIAANKQQPKKLLVDVYTEWCGWCKKMDAKVFTDPAIEAYIKKNFYAVKFDAEQKETILYDGYTFNFNTEATRRGVHDLAIALLDSRMSYPSIVYLDENRDRISISPGFKPADKFIHELNFIQEGHYKLKTYQEYLQTLGKK
jgi:thioredoxin-related protein